jgi:hypothetical protein
LFTSFAVPAVPVVFPEVTGAFFYAGFIAVFVVVVVVVGFIF